MYKNMDIYKLVLFKKKLIFRIKAETLPTEPSKDKKRPQ